MDHDWYQLWTHYWWLIFPLFWMVAASARIWARHSESQRILDMIKTHTDQGKDPPASLVEMFKTPRGGRCGYGRYSEPYYTYRLWRRFFLFALLCAVFATTSYWHDGWLGEAHHWSGMFIPALVFGALALGNLAGLLFRPRLPPDQTPDRK